MINLIEKLDENKKCYIIDINDTNTEDLLNVIKREINGCDLFICDMTAETVDPDDTRPTYNPSVMYELGYAMNQKPSNDMMLMINKSFSKNKPDMLKGLYCEECFGTTDDDVDEIYDKLVKIINRKFNENHINYQKIEYKLGTPFLIALEPFITLKIKEWEVCINKKKKTGKIIINFNPLSKYGVSRRIDVQAKTLIILKKKEETIDLSRNKEIYDELIHIEIIASLNWFK